MAGQKIELSPEPVPVVSRPLKTGAQFTLILAKKRFVYRHWDKEKYLPGEDAQLIMEGEGIGEEKYEFIIQRADSEGGPWTEVARVEAKAEGDKATAHYKIPKPVPKGHLTKAEWKRLAAKPGDQLGMHVEAENYEGGWLSIHVEKQNDAGEWEVYTRWQGEIENGKYDSAFAIPPAPEKPEQWKAGKVVELSFLEPPRENEPAWMLAKTASFDGSQLQFVLERTDANGNWYELGTAVSTVSDDEAKNSVPVPALVIKRPGEPAPEGMEAIRFAKDAFSSQEELIVWVDPVWLKGVGFEVMLEQRVMVDGEDWKQVAVVDAKPSTETADQPGPGDETPPPQPSEPATATGPAPSPGPGAAAEPVGGATAQPAGVPPPSATAAQPAPSGQPADSSGPSPALSPAPEPSSSGGGETAVAVGAPVVGAGVGLGVSAATGGIDAGAAAGTSGVASAGSGEAATAGSGAAADSGASAAADSGASAAADSGTSAAADSGTSAAADSGTSAAADSGTSAAADTGTSAADSGASAGSDAASAGSDVSSAGDAAQSAGDVTDTAGDAGDRFSNALDQADSAQAQADDLQSQVEQAKQQAEDVKQQADDAGKESGRDDGSIEE